MPRSRCDYSASCASIALVISVALNLLAVGFLVGRGLKHGPGKHGDRHGLGGPDARLPRHPLLRDVMDRHRGDFDARRDAVMQARKAVARITSGVAILLRGDCAQAADGPGSLKPSGIATTLRG